MEEETFALRDVLRIVRHHRWQILALTLVAVICAVVITFSQPPRYTAVTQLVVGPAVPDAALPDARGASKAGPLGLDLPAETQARVVASPLMASRVAHALRIPPDAAHIEELTKRVQVKAVTDNLLLITVNAPSAVEAAAVANAYANEYILYRRDAANSAVQALSSDSKRRMVKLKTTELGGGQIIAPATRPRGSSSPSPIRNILIGILLGGAAGVTIALFREHTSDRVQTRDDAARLTHASVLGAIPRNSPFLRASRGELVTLQAPRSVASNAYRELRSNLVRRGLGTQVRGLLVTSVGPGADAAETVGNLGVMCARAGLRTVVMSADLRHSRLHGYFGIAEAPGLASVLANGDQLDRSTLTSKLYVVNIPNLFVLPSGAADPDLGELLEFPPLGSIFELATGIADVVIVEAPPILNNGDVITLAGLADATLLVVRAGVDKETLTARAASLLEMTGCLVQGVVLQGARKDDETVGRIDDRPWDLELRPTGPAGLRTELAPIRRAGSRTSSSADGR